MQLPRRSTRFLKRIIVSSDKHTFIGRIYDLGVVAFNFETYEELAKYPDCKYAIDTGEVISNLAKRVESLNVAGRMLWPENSKLMFDSMPINHYEWLTVATDVFIIRYVSVIDCALLLVNEVFQSGLSPRECTIGKIEKASLPEQVVDHLRSMMKEQEKIRFERNSRIHHGIEREFTDDDQIFRLAALFHASSGGLGGNDRHGRKTDVDRYFREALVTLQGEFRLNVKSLENRLNYLYDLLSPEFEKRFGPLVASSVHGLNAQSHARNKREI